MYENWTVEYCSFSSDLPSFFNQIIWHIFYWIAKVMTIWTGSMKFFNDSSPLLPTAGSMVEIIEELRGKYDYQKKGGKYDGNKSLKL